MAGHAAVRIHASDGVLHIAGALSRATVPTAWSRALPLLDGLRGIDVTDVSEVDSAGVALLAELAARVGHPAIQGDPSGLAALRSAYRLTDAMDFSTSG